VIFRSTLYIAAIRNAKSGIGVSDNTILNTLREGGGSRNFFTWIYLLFSEESENRLKFIGIVTEDGSEREEM